MGGTLRVGAAREQQLDDGREASPRGAQQRRAALRIGRIDIEAEIQQASHGIAITGEWLLDNYHVIEEQIQLARRHLPTGYSRQLPSLSQGALRGLPRVYALTIEAVSHGDGRIDGETLRRFIAGYQIVAPLKMGELWAVPIMLRLALIENLRRMASHVMRDGAHRRLASTWARRRKP